MELLIFTGNDFKQKTISTLFLELFAVRRSVDVM